MRVEVLNSGHGLKAKALFAFIKLVSKRPPPDVIKMLMVGARVTEVCSVLLRHGITRISAIERELGLAKGA